MRRHAERLLRPALVALMGGVTVLGGCAHTNPGGGADIVYRMPRTDVAADLSFELQSCSGRQLSVTVTPTITATPSVQAGLIHVSAANLASARVERDLEISTGDDLVLSGVNAQTADQTIAILANVAKIALAFGGAPAAMGTPGYEICTLETRQALKRALFLKERIELLRSSLADDGVAADAELGRELKRRLRELGELKAGQLLVTTSFEMRLPDAVGQGPWGEARRPLSASDFEKWFGDRSETVTTAYFPVTWSASRVASAPPAPPASAGRRLRPCGKSLAVPAASDVEFSVSGEGDIAGLKASHVFPVAQVNPPAELCIDAGFGEKRSTSVAFDKFGRTTSLHWASAATAANITGGLAGIAPDAKALLTREPGPSVLELQKGEIDRLKTLQEFNAMKACEAILAAGGSDCGADGS